MTSLRYLLARAVTVEQRVRRAVETRRAIDPDPDDAFRGLYLTEENVARLLDEEGSRSFPPLDDEPPEDLASSRLTTLATEFGLTPLDIEILLIALVPDLDDRFEAFYGYLNDDVTRRRPSIGLALGLCGSTPADHAARARLAARSPLRAGGLLLVEDLERPFLSRALRVPDRVTAHLLGDDTPDPRLADLMAPWQAVRGVGDPAPLAAVLADGVRLAYLSEDQGGAGTALAASALTAAGLGVLGLDLSRLAEDPAPADAIRALVREARLTNAGLVCAPLDAVSREHTHLLRLLTATHVPAILVGRTPWDASWSTSPHCSCTRLGWSRRRVGRCGRRRTNSGPRCRCRRRSKQTICSLPFSSPRNRSRERHAALPRRPAWRVGNSPPTTYAGEPAPRTRRAWTVWPAVSNPR